MSQRYVEFLNLVDMFRSGALSADDVRKLRLDPDWELKKTFLKVLYEEIYEDFFEGVAHNRFAELLSETVQAPLKTSVAPYIQAKVAQTARADSALKPSVTRRKVAGSYKLGMVGSSTCERGIMQGVPGLHLTDFDVLLSRSGLSFIRSRFCKFSHR